jgi:hypothetical protein
MGQAPDTEATCAPYNAWCDVVDELEERCLGSQN